MDLLVCEVKEGKGRLNPNLRRNDVLVATLRRVGCCPEPAVAHHVRELLRRGETIMEHGGVRCRARVAVFAGRAGEPAWAGLAIPLAHVASFVGYLRDHARLLQAAHLSQPALAFFQTAGQAWSTSLTRPVSSSHRPSPHAAPVRLRDGGLGEGFPTAGG
jgi:hypothetical protein